MSSGIRPGTRAGCRTRPGSNSAGCDAIEGSSAGRAMEARAEFRRRPPRVAPDAGRGLRRIEAALERLVSLGAVSPHEDLDEGEPVASDEAASAPRKLYETVLHQLAAEERAARAKAAEEPELSALCFDPLPAVVHALLDNPRFGLAQARLVAAHHRTAAGLEALGARAALAADAGVRRALLRNPQLPAGLLRRLHGGRRLLEQHKLVVSRDVPEQTRRVAR